MGWTGTPAEKRAYAIKKAKERQAEAERRGARLLDGYEVAPHNHPCDAYDIEYDVLEGPGIVSSARCNVCGRTWTRTRNRRGYPELKVVPLTRQKPKS